MRPNVSFQGDGGAVQFLAGVRDRVEHLLRRYRIPPQDGEDLVQQALLAMLYRRHEIHDMEAWFVGTLRNRCRLYWRDRYRHRSLETPIERVMPPEQERRELQLDLELAIAALPERCKSVLRLKYGLGYVAGELADATGYRPSSVQKVTARCLAALAEKMEDHRIEGKARLSR